MRWLWWRLAASCCLPFVGVLSVQTFLLFAFVCSHELPAHRVVFIALSLRCCCCGGSTCWPALTGSSATDHVTRSNLRHSPPRDGITSPAINRCVQNCLLAFFCWYLSFLLVFEFIVTLAASSSPVVVAAIAVVVSRRCCGRGCCAVGLLELLPVVVIASDVVAVMWYVAC